jgi:hypothetical protein
MLFQLAESRGSHRGVYCGADGVYLGSSALIERCEEMYMVRGSRRSSPPLTTRHPTQKVCARGSTPLPRICSAAISARR